MTPRFTTLHPPLAAALAVVTLTVGCTHTPRAAAPPRPAEVHAGVAPLTAADGSPRSLALDPVSLTSLPPRRAWDTPPPAWIDARNERGPVAFAGYRSPTLETSVTLTRDRQATFNGRPFDNYQQRTFRESYVEAVR